MLTTTSLSPRALLPVQAVFEAIKPKLESEDIRFEPILLSKEQRQTLLAK